MFMKFLICVAALSVAWPLWACDLGLVSPAQSSLKNPVQAQVSVEGDYLIVNFEVEAASIFAKSKLGPKEYPFMFDVVEVFVSVAESGFPYYEFELSPYNQTFQVQINDLKQPFINGVDMGLISQTRLVRGGWSGQLKIPLKNLGWDGDVNKIRGNLYAIQGRKPKRSFWSAFLPPQSKVNFHQPQFFTPLLNGCGE